MALKSKSRSNIIDNWYYTEHELCSVCDPSGISNALTFDNVNACQCERLPCLHDKFQMKLIRGKSTRKKRIRKGRNEIENNMERFGYLNICQGDDDLLSDENKIESDLNSNFEQFCDNVNANCFDKNENNILNLVTELDNNLNLALSKNGDIENETSPSSKDNLFVKKSKRNKEVNLVDLNNEKNLKAENVELSEEGRTLHNNSGDHIGNVKPEENKKKKEELDVENVLQMLKKIQPLSKSSSLEEGIRYCEHKTSEISKQKSESRTKAKSSKKKKENDGNSSDWDSDSSSSSSGSGSSTSDFSSSSESSGSDTSSSDSSSSDEDDSSSSSSSESTSTSSSSSSSSSNEDKKRGKNKKQKITH